MNSNDKSYSSSYSKVFSNPIATDVRNSSFKTDDPFALENKALSDGPVDSSYIYKSKHDFPAQREKAPHLSYGGNVDSIKNVLVPEKNFHFPVTTRSFKYEWLLLFSWLRYSPSEDTLYCLSCALFGHDFLTRASCVKKPIFTALQGLAKRCFLL